MELNGKKIVFLGDSITEGCGTSGRDKCFVTLVGERGGFRESKNYGIGATRIARQSAASADKNWDNDFCARVEELDGDADIVGVFGGTNDYYWSDGGIEGNDPSCFRFAAEQLCGGLRDRYPGKRIVLLTPYKQRGHGNVAGAHDFRDADDHCSDARNFSGHTLGDYARVLREVCAARDIPVLDLYGASGVDVAHSDEDFRRYTLDGCHPNEAGHALLAEALRDFWKTL